ncbi:hypothetical protein GH741_00615 [Aquibacillus halophilus]|uniref:Uncharacterized protein n=1 Tax=Aquibacillus halophilus TaxID=930132 RepID=A0A6A8D5Y4_9BACI|nr:hypothetical protein [Aquibacillus halophilus]MRH41175.1 hypothetical protein [Aquibacillus halophilus]
MKTKTITIGVTGHRDITSSLVSNVASEVNLFFENIKKEYPNHIIIVKSPLAEGADRLVAKSALAHGAKLIVPLPLAKEDYTRDFETETSIMEFESLCLQAEKVFTPDIVKATETRNDAYYSIGAYIALTSDILLALWDKRSDLEKKGGTAHIVREQIEGFPKHIMASIDQKENRKTYVIHTPRTPNYPNTVRGAYFSIE